MDKYFESVNDIYLNQPFHGTTDKSVIEECRGIARAYALNENAIVSMGNNLENCSYCYFGGLADVLGLVAEERLPVIPSLYENFVFGRANADDLTHRHAHELAFLNFTRPMPAHERRDYYMSDFMRVRNRDDCWIWIEHRMFPLASLSDGSYWLCMCVYTLCRDETRKARFVNTRTGEIRILTNRDYENILSEREREVLQAISDGLLSKEIAGQFSISVNTVNRHRQNILQKLNVDNAIAACRAAKAMGLIT